jgi:hypothetical protein
MLNILFTVRKKYFQNKLNIFFLLQRPDQCHTHIHGQFRGHHMLDWLPEREPLLDVHAQASAQEDQGHRESGLRRRQQALRCVRQATARQGLRGPADTVARKPECEAQRVHKQMEH